MLVMIIDLAIATDFSTLKCVGTSLVDRDGKRLIRTRHSKVVDCACEIIPKHCILEGLVGRR